MLLPPAGNNGEAASAAPTAAAAADFEANEDEDTDDEDDDEDEDAAAASAKRQAILDSADLSAQEKGGTSSSDFFCAQKYTECTSYWPSLVGN